MSYASVAASGPAQSAEEVSFLRAPAIPQVQHTTDDPSSTLDVDNPHISTVPSDFASQPIQTRTQATQHSHEASDAALRESASAEASRAARSAEQKARRAKEVAKKNSDNPVVVGNAVVLGVVAAVLGWGAWKRVQRGPPVGWETVLGWTGVVAAVGLGDYVVSSWLVRKYPVKK